MTRNQRDLLVRNRDKDTFVTDFIRDGVPEVIRLIDLCVAARSAGAKDIRITASDFDRISRYYSCD